MTLLSKIGLGTVQFGLDYGISNHSGQTPFSEVSKILTSASQMDIDLIDTASAYGNSEEVLGRFELANFKIVSKFMPPNDGESIAKQLNTSLRRLNVTHIYGYLSHRPNDVFENLKSWDELVRLRELGLVEKIGFSFNHLYEIEEALNRNIIPDLIQVPYNILDNRFEGFMKELKNQGCEIHTRSTFLQGLFFMSPEDLPSYFDSVKCVLKELQFFGDGLSSMLLGYCLSKPFIDKVIVGVNNQKQFFENLVYIEKFDYFQFESYQFAEDILVPSNWPKM